MNSMRMLYSLIVCIVILIYPILFTIDHVSMIVKSDEYIKLGFAVENNTLYNLKLVEKELNRKVDIFHIFQKINEEPKLETMQEALDRGYIVLLTLEPWQGREHNNDMYSPQEIINGSIDQDIDRWAVALNSLEYQKGKVIIRPMHEINGNWYPWCAYTTGSSPENSKQAYIHVVDRFKSTNKNLLFMFGINYRGVKYEEGRVEYIYDVNETLLDDNYYDFIGISGYNRVSKNHQWKTFSELYHPMYVNLTNNTNKPIWITEISSPSKGGDKAEWTRDMFYQVKYNYKEIDAIVWFDENKWFEGEITDWAFDSTPECKIAFKESVRIENMKKV